MKAGMGNEKHNRNQGRKAAAFSGKRAWLAMGTIAAYAAAGSASKSALLFASPHWGRHQDTQAQLTVRRFDIPAGPLDIALQQFAKECGLTIEYTVPRDTIPGFKSRGVTGLYSQQQALKQILAGTGLDFTLPGPHTVSVGVKNAQSIQVNATVTDSIALAKVPTPLVDTPQSITAIPKHILADQGVSTLRDTLRNAPGISLAAGEGGAQGDNLTIRGFSAQNDIFLDGMRDFGDYYRDPFNYEQVDVLEGPAGVEFGRGSTGGVINQESKRPEMRPFVVVDAEGGTDATRRFTADISEPLPDFAGGTAFRLNVMGHDSNIAQRDVVTSRRYGIAPSLAFGLNTPTRVSASYYHFTEDDIPDYGLPWYFGRPAPVPRHNYYGFSDRNFLRTDVDMGTVKVEHDLGTHGILRDAVRYGNYQRKWQITEPQLNNASTGPITPDTPLDQVKVNRNQLTGQSVETSFWDQADLTLTGKLLGLRQTAVAGVEGGKETSDPIREMYTNAAGVNTVPLTELLDPDPYVPFSGTESPKSNIHTTAHSFGAYLLDTFEFGPHWQVSGGARWDRFDARYDGVTYAFAPSGDLIGTPAKYIQPVDKPTWRGALVYKPTQNGSIYFDYGTSFDPSAEALSLTAATAATPPEENETFELGSKWDLKSGHLTARGAIFRTNKENTREPDPNDSSVDVLSGTQRADGAEAVLQGHLTDRWDILSSYTYLHAEVVSSQYYPAAVGQPLNNVPSNLFNLWTEYHPSHRVEVGGGGNFVGARTANTATMTPGTTVETAPGYWNFNAMFKYELSEHAAFQVNMNNLTDRFYIDEVHPGHAIPGAGTSALFGLKFKF
jgi:catecholate siderophore receptor